MGNQLHSTKYIQEYVGCEQFWKNKLKYKGWREKNSTGWGKGQETEMGSEKQKGKDIQGSDYVNPTHQHWLEQN